MQEKNMKLVLPAAKIAELERHCSRFVDVGQKEGCLFDQEVVFDDGMRMAVQVCLAPSEPCWTQAVLFTPNGEEVGCTDVGDFFEDVYTLDHDNVIYSVTVCSIESQPSKSDTF